MDRDYPIGTRVRLIEAVPAEICGKMAAVVPDTDIAISWPDDPYGGNPIALRLDATFNSYVEN